MQADFDPLLYLRTIYDNLPGALGALAQGDFKAFESAFAPIREQHHKVLGKGYHLLDVCHQAQTKYGGQDVRTCILHTTNLLILKHFLHFCNKSQILGSTTQTEIMQDLEIALLTYQDVELPGPWFEKISW